MAADEPNFPPENRGAAPGAPPWQAMADAPEYKGLLRSKARFVVPMTIFFLVYYFALLVLVGYFPDLMKIKVGPCNLAYVFAFSQFIMSWAVAYAYVRAAARWDKSAAEIVRRFTTR